jgi:hypothetical protein
MLGTLVIGGLLLFSFTYALFGDRASPQGPFRRAEVGETRRALVGAAVLAADGTHVGTVTGLSRSSNGRIDRIRVSTSRAFEPQGAILIVRHGEFSVDGGAVHLALTVGQVKALPRVMTDDGAAG